jgi:hypothetical protein
VAFRGLSRGHAKKNLVVATSTHQMPPTEKTWGAIYKRSLDHAVRRLRYFQLSAQLGDARQVVQEAMTQLLTREEDPPAEEAELLQAVGSAINGITVNLNRKKASRCEQADTRVAEQSRSEQRSPEQVVADREETSERITALLTRLAGDNEELAQRVVMARADGLDDISEIAGQLGVEVRAVYKANRVIRQHADALRAEWNS